MLRCFLCAGQHPQTLSRWHWGLQCDSWRPEDPFLPTGKLVEHIFNTCGNRYQLTWILGLQRLKKRLRLAAGRCGCRSVTMDDVHEPSTGTGSGGHDTPLQVADDIRQDEIGPSQLHDAPSTQASPRRLIHPPNRYTPGTDALGKGKGKTKRRTWVDARCIACIMDCTMDCFMYCTMDRIVLWIVVWTGLYYVLWYGLYYGGMCVAKFGCVWMTIFIIICHAMYENTGEMLPKFSHTTNEIASFTT
jgi:hypothetical protein